MGRHSLAGDNLSDNEKGWGGGGREGEKGEGKEEKFAGLGEIFGMRAFISCYCTVIVRHVDWYGQYGSFSQVSFFFSSTRLDVFVQMF